MRLYSRSGMVVLSAHFYLVASAVGQNIRGQVVDAKRPGTGVQGAVVTFVAMNLPAVNAATDSAGRFAVALRPGKYVVSLAANAYRRLVDSLEVMVENEQHTLVLEVMPTVYALDSLVVRS